MTSPSESGGGLEGVRVELRMIVDHEPEQRFDVNGVELLQIRGRVVDSQHQHPQVVVRFAGQQRAQLYRWAKPGKHLSVVGQLEVKSWTTSNRIVQLALLVEARDVHPLNPDQVDHTREGVHTVPGRVGKQLSPRLTRAESAATLRRMLE